MKKFATLSSVLVLAALAFGLTGHEGASAQSAPPNSISLTLASGSPTLKADNAFDFVLLATVNTKGTPFRGVFNLDTAFGGGLGYYGLQLVNGNAVTYTPSYWAPQSNKDSILIKVTGKIDPRIAHPWVATKATVGPPPNNASDTQAQVIR